MKMRPLQLLLLGLAAVLVIGCAANTENDVNTTAPGVNTTETDQAQAQQGSHVVIHVYPQNDADPGGTLPSQLADALGRGEGPPIADSLTASGGDGSSAGMTNARAGHLQIAPTMITVNTGASTGTQSGEAAGTASGSANPSTTASTDQTIKAALEIMLQLAQSGQQRGGTPVIDGTGDASGETRADQTSELILQLMKENAELKKKPPANPEPTTQPAGDAGTLRLNPDAT